MYDWEDYLAVADDLLARAGGEGAERTAISRAYYASYGKACEYARSRGAALTYSGSDHRTVWQWFASQQGRGVAHARIAEHGNRLKRWRIKADYQAGFAGSASTAPLAVSTAHAP